LGKCAFQTASSVEPAIVSLGTGSEANLQKLILIFMSNVFWWIRQVILTLMGCFFLVFGIQLLISAYQLNNPFWFVMTFFASNLIILISAALVVGFIVRMVCSRKTSESTKK
jgi:hypothetical protein